MFVCHCWNVVCLSFFSIPEPVCSRPHPLLIETCECVCLCVRVLRVSVVCVCSRPSVSVNESVSCLWASLLLFVFVFSVTGCGGGVAGGSGKWCPLTCMHVPRQYEKNDVLPCPSIHMHVSVLFVPPVSCLLPHGVGFVDHDLQHPELDDP